MSWRNYLRQPALSLSMLLLLGFVVLCSLQVIVRFVLPIPFSWTEELVSASVIWMTFLGVIAVERRQTHIRVELLDEMLAPKPLAIVYGLFDLTILACLVALVWGGWETLSEISFQRTPALGIPINVLIGVVPLASAVLAVIVARNMLRRTRAAWRAGEPS